ncbi:hypothetical protein J4440_00620 [Candidatus Woesearchaeota archaeon]|nr:hypothetical protein [Candidatus Woesearchaeota archaeon]
MKIRTLEKLVSPIRLGWHGIPLIGLGIGGFYSVNYDVHNKLDTYIFINNALLLSIGLEMYYYALKSFIKTSRNIKKYNRLDKKIVKPQLLYYCNRQGVRTAAVNYGFAEDFDRIMNEYDGKMKFRFIPLI